MKAVPSKGSSSKVQIEDQSPPSQHSCLQLERHREDWSCISSEDYFYHKNHTSLWSVHVTATWVNRLEGTAADFEKHLPLAGHIKERADFLHCFLVGSGEPGWLSTFLEKKQGFGSWEKREMGTMASCYRQWLCDKSLAHEILLQYNTYIIYILYLCYMYICRESAEYFN